MATPGAIKCMMGGQPMNECFLRVLQVYEDRRTVLLADNKFYREFPFEENSPNLQAIRRGGVVNLESYAAKMDQHGRVSVEIQLMTSTDRADGDAVDMKPWIDEDFQFEDVSLKSLSEGSAHSPFETAVKVDIINKTRMRDWPESHLGRNDGANVAFSMIIADNSCQMVAVALRSNCTRFYNMFKKGRTYYIFNFGLRQPDNNYSSSVTLGRLEMILNGGKTRVFEEYKIREQINVKCASVRGIHKLRVGDLVDFVGTCREMSEVEEVSWKRLLKRTLTLVDSNGDEIDLILWGDEAKMIRKQAPFSMMVYDAKVEIFDGNLQLTITQSSFLWFGHEVNEDVEENKFYM